MRFTILGMFKTSFYVLRSKGELFSKIDDFYDASAITLNLIRIPEKFDEIVSEFGDTSTESQQIPRNSISFLDFRPDNTFDSPERSGKFTRPKCSFVVQVRPCLSAYRMARFVRVMRALPSVVTIAVGILAAIRSVTVFVLSPSWNGFFF